MVSQHKTMVTPFLLTLVRWPSEANYKGKKPPVLSFRKEFYMGPTGVFNRKTKFYGYVLEIGNLTILLKSQFLKC